MGSQCGSLFGFQKLFDVVQTFLECLRVPNDVENFSRGHVAIVAVLVIVVAARVARRVFGRLEKTIGENVTR